MASSKRRVRKGKARKTSFLKRIFFGLFAAMVAFYCSIVVALILLRWVNPPFTAVQVERRVAALTEHEPYNRRYSFEPLSGISSHLRHAVVAAEDARFYQHHGFDWKELENAAVEDWEDGRRRGASTITQQLVRNLFLSTGRSVIRKAVEFSIVPLTEAILPKQRILELYLNVIEWGRGVYGAEAASRYYFREPAARLSREQAAELAEVLPAPLHRRPDHLTAYGERILERMRQMGF